MRSKDFMGTKNIPEASIRNSFFIWDIDGTLLKTSSGDLKTDEAALNLALEEVLGVSISNIWSTYASQEGEFLQGKTDIEVIEAILRSFSRANRITIEQVASLMQRNYCIIENGDAFQPTSYALETVGRIFDRNLNQVIVTGNLDQIAKKKLDSVVLTPYFPIRFTPSSENPTRVSMTKQAIDYFIQNHGLRQGLDDVFMIGDTPNDIDAARECAATAISVSTGKFSYENLRDLNPKNTYRSLAEVQHLIS